MAKAALNKKETLFTSQLNLNLMKKLILDLVHSLCMVLILGHFGKLIRNNVKVLRCAGERWK
jgi:hypothetical protein